MKTYPLDFFLSTLCIAMLLAASTGTVLLLSPDHPTYGILFDILIFLSSYGLWSGVAIRLAHRIRPYPTGTHGMESAAFTHWKLYAVLADLAMKALAPFTNVVTEPLIISLFGTKVGKNTAQAGTLRDHPLLVLEDFCTIGQNSVITAHIITGNEIHLAPIRIGKNAVVGINCTVMPGVELGENSVLAPGAVATVDTKIPANELWGGIPARKIKDLHPRGH